MQLIKQEMVLTVGIAVASVCWKNTRHTWLLSKTARMSQKLSWRRPAKLSLMSSLALNISPKNSKFSNRFALLYLLWLKYMKLKNIELYFSVAGIVKVVTGKRVSGFKRNCLYSINNDNKGTKGWIGQWVWRAREMTEINHHISYHF